MIGSVRTSRLQFLAQAGLLAVLALSMAGCGPEKGSVSGVVKYNGKPLPGGTVSFVHPTKGASQIAQIQPDGSYTVPDAWVGECKIIVTTVAPLPSVLTVPGVKVPWQKPTTPSGAFKPAGEYVPIPSKYAGAGSTPLTFTVTGGSQTYDIELED